MRPILLLGAFALLALAAGCGQKQDSTQPVVSQGQPSPHTAVARPGVAPTGPSGPVSTGAKPMTAPPAGVN